MCDNVDLYLVGKNGIGFLGDRERLNVAMTRAKMALILIGDFNTLKVFFIVLVFLVKDAHTLSFILLNPLFMWINQVFKGIENENIRKNSF